MRLLEEMRYRSIGADEWMIHHIGVGYWWNYLLWVHWMVSLGTCLVFVVLLDTAMGCPLLGYQLGAGWSGANGAARGD